MPKEHRFNKLLDPRLDSKSLFSIFISLQNHGSLFGIGYDLRWRMKPRIPRIHSPGTLKSQLNHVGLTISYKEPDFSYNFTLPGLLQKEFERIKRDILSDITRVFCKSRHKFLISGTPAKVEYDLMRPAYIELKFHDSVSMTAMMDVLLLAPSVQEENL